MKCQSALVVLQSIFDAMLWIWDFGLFGAFILSTVNSLMPE